MAGVVPAGTGVAMPTGAVTAGAAAKAGTAGARPMAVVAWKGAPWVILVRVAISPRAPASMETTVAGAAPSGTTTVTDAKNATGFPVAFTSPGQTLRLVGQIV